MDQYVTVGGIYENGNVHLLEMPDKNLEAHTEVLVLVPVRRNMTKKKQAGIPVNDFVRKINLFAIGSDSVNETEELYHD